MTSPLESSDRAAELLQLLQLERIDTRVWRGQNEARFGARLFGGQVLAQALVAATNTVAPDRHCHSLHGYFLRPGRADVPVIYQVESIRDGKSFITRRIKAIQNGEAIFSMDASFHIQEPGLAHQIDMQDLPEPESLVDDRDIATKPNDPNPQWTQRERPFEVRSVFQQGRPAEDDTSQPIWIRYQATVPDVQSLHRYLLTYASDMSLVSTAVLPHRHEVQQNQLQVASLDHALWFHHDVDVNDWLVYIKETTQAGAGRGFNRGAFYTRAGKLVASALQEGVIRVRTPRDDSQTSA
jgi:acyl-CoA thioesterase II